MCVFFVLQPMVLTNESHILSILNGIGVAVVVVVVGALVVVVAALTECVVSGSIAIWAPWWWA